MLGMHFTPVEVFHEYIMPQIADRLKDYLWVDMFCGEGNLILPMLEYIDPDERLEFFRKHMMCFDIDGGAVERSIQNARRYGIPPDIAGENIRIRDTLKDYPALDGEYPVFHITNPPYLYLGYIKKQSEAYRHRAYFHGENAGYQDLYQIAMMNDLRHGIDNMIYIVPSNFLFADAGTRKIREDFLTRYRIESCFIFERRIFSFTGTNVMILGFQRSQSPIDKMEFEAMRVNRHIERKRYVLYRENNFRPGNEYQDYVRNNFKPDHPVIRFYLTYDEVIKNPGSNRVVLVDSKDYKHGDYAKETFYVNDDLYDSIRSNPLYVRTVDKGTPEGRSGLYWIADDFDADGVFVKGPTYRTSPIQVFLQPRLTENESRALMAIFNRKLNEMREKSNSDFMTTYKYSDSSAYVRKYLGLKQVREIINTISIDELKGAGAYNGTMP
ncbi:MAG: N-6 DNA methylase [Thermoplasma sp.]|nr:MAG: N-6 DNA methylase [Thermoplasma sp.]